MKVKDESEKAGLKLSIQKTKIKFPITLSEQTGSGRSLGEGNGYSVQHSCLENSMDRGAWKVAVHGLAKSQIGSN